MFSFLDIKTIKFNFRANIAAAAGGIIFFMLYLPYSFMVVWEEALDPKAKIFSVIIVWRPKSKFIRLDYTVIWCFDLIWLIKPAL